MTLQRALREQLIAEGKIEAEHLSPEMFQRHFQLLQACDNLSLLSCVDYDGDATLLWPQTLLDGGTSEVKVQRVGERTFKLTPYPFAEREMAFKLKTRHVVGKSFASGDALKSALDGVEMQEVEVTVVA
jgi:hypothetical protein